MYRLRLFLLILILIMITLSSCVMTIATIQEDPLKYANKKIMIAGEIDTLLNIPFTTLYIFTFKDSTGSAVVFSEKKHESGESFVLSGTIIAFSGEEFKGESKKSAIELKKFLIENNVVNKEIAQSVAEIIIKTVGNIAGGLEHIFFIKET